MEKILGYTTEEWHDIFIVLKVKGYRTTNMYEVLKLWRSIPKESVDDCLKIASIYAQNTNLDVTEYHEFLRNFLGKVN